MRSRSLLGFDLSRSIRAAKTMNAIPPATVPNFKGSATTQGLIYGTGVKYQLPMNTLLFGHVHG